jgi:hypothetical protein
VVAFLATVLTCASPPLDAQIASPIDRPQVPVVLVVGCATPGPERHIWTLSSAGARSESSRAGITAAEKIQARERRLGQDSYQLIGVADFVDPESSRKIGDRGAILTPPRVNATGMLASGHKVAVKGLLVDAKPARINLTSVVDLGPACP